MIGLFEAVEACTGRQAAAITKHLKAAGVEGWDGLTRSGLYRLRDTVEASCAPGTARTYFAVLKSMFARYGEEAGVCPEFRAILREKGEKPVKTFLTPAELAKLAGVETRTRYERLAVARFLLSAYTGMRISDAVTVSPECLDRETSTLTYTSVKTGITACVPAGKKAEGWIAEVKAGEEAGGMPLKTYNLTLRRLCRRAGLCASVRVHRGGVDMSGEKWRYVSSHTARISFATNLSRAGVQLIDLSRMMGHSSTAMTERYIVGTAPKLSAKAMAYLGTEEAGDWMAANNYKTAMP